MLKGLLFINIASVNVLLKRGVITFKDFIVEINKNYLLVKMLNNRINMIQVYELAQEKDNHLLYLPFDLYTPGSTPWYDLVVLALLVKRYNPKSIFEIGSFEGLGSLIMCNNCTNETLYTLDLPLKNSNLANVSKFAIKDHSIGTKNYQSGKFFDKIRPEVTIKHLYGDSWNFDFSPFYNSIDFFFIDGAHTSKYVIKDTLNAIKCIRNDGLIVWHDVKNSKVLNPILRVASSLKIYHVVHSNICFAIINAKPDQVIEVLNKELKKFVR